MARGKKKSGDEKPVSMGRHEQNCKVCSSPHRGEIEQEFLEWKSPTQIAIDFDIRDRTTLYRHAHATGLMDRRRRNVRAALERIIEHAGSVKVNAGAVVQAVAAYARINSDGRLVERSERVDLNALFERMTEGELDEYAKTGHLPDWFEATVGNPDEVNTSR